MVGFVNSPPVYQEHYDPKRIYEPYYGKGLNQEYYLHASGNLRVNLRITSFIFMSHDCGIVHFSCSNIALNQLIWFININ